MSMKILMIPSTMLPFPPIRGGAVQNLIDFFVSWNETHAQNELTVFSIYDRSAKLESEARAWKHCTVKFIKLPQILFWLRDSVKGLIAGFASKVAFKLIHICYTAKLRRALKSRKAMWDLIVLDNTPQFFKTVYEATRGKICIHIFNDYLNSGTKNIAYILQRAEKIITVSDYLSRRVLDTGFIQPDRVVKINNATELEKYGTAEAKKRGFDLRRKYEIPSDACVFIFVARLVREKGIRELIEAFIGIKNPCAHLVVVGNKIYSGAVVDPFLLELQSLASQGEGRIHFTGYIDYDQLPDYYAMADVGILPSLYEEPFSLAAIEYMASGLALIVSDAGGFPEMVQDHAALIVKRGQNMVSDLREDMEMLLNDKKLLERYKAAAKQRSKQFDV